MSLSGAVAGRSPSLPLGRAAAPGRARLVRPGRAAPASRRPLSGPRARVSAVLLALVLGAGGAVLLLAIVSPGALSTVTGPPAAAPPTVEVVVPATVLHASPCTTAGARDVVSVPVGGQARPVALEACGSIVGSTVTVRVLTAPGEGEHADRGSAVIGEARVLGTGSDAPLADSADTPSPIAGRITVTLTVAAGIAMAGLLVALGRDRSRTRTTPSRTDRAGTSRGARPAPQPRSAPARRAADRGTADRRAPRTPHPVRTGGRRRVAGSTARAGRAASRSSRRSPGAGRRPAPRRTRD